MAQQFKVEDGTGLTGANAYCNVAYLRQYWDNFGYDYSTISESQLMTYIIRSSHIVDSRYRSFFPGTKLLDAQAREWPREDSYYPVDKIEISSSIVPEEIKNAVCEMAFALNGGTDLQPVNTSSDATYERDVVDVIETERRYDNGRKSTTVDRVTAVDDALSRFTGGIPGAYNLKIIRVGG